MRAITMSLHVFQVRMRVYWRRRYFTPRGHFNGHNMRLQAAQSTLQAACDHLNNLEQIHDHASTATASTSLSFTGLEGNFPA